jgi:hypothetical protein
MNYVDFFKERIKHELSHAPNDKAFVDSLFVKIKDDILSAGSLLGLHTVNEITLKSYFETAKREYLSVNPIDPGLTYSLTKKGFKTWLEQNRENDIQWSYSDRYFKYLLKTGRSHKVAEETRRSSLSIVKKIADPKSENSVYVKGLVVGAVQSGKTGNFNAVINRSIDCGYGLIIVLSGIMEDLRSQTQRRIETDVIGEGRNIDRGSIGKKGVGEIERFGPLGDSNVKQVKSITSIESDFNQALLDSEFSLNDINILVCKKNVSVLRNLIVWLHDCLEDGKTQHNIPFLLLDDEADNASLNNLGAKGNEYASKTNSQIRALLALFNRKTYLGYTATPFANVLQDRNDTPDEKYIEKYKTKGNQLEKELNREGNIFPDDFIELLDPPSNYVGAKQIFETLIPIENSTEDNDKIPLIAPPVKDYINSFPSRVIETDEGQIVGVENYTQQEWDEKIGESGYLNFYSFREYRKGTHAPKKEDSFPKELPESLIEAVNCFLLTLAIRESRIKSMIQSELYQPHNTMLVHISRFTNWQITTKKLLEKYVAQRVADIKNFPPIKSSQVYNELEHTWNKHYAHIVEYIKLYVPKGYEDEFMIPIVFDSIKRILPIAVDGIEIKAINSTTKDRLEYPKHSPKKYIAIGGNRLSRGFTLEGLSINYFIRTTNYSDALLQMGRWFGYRPGYLDCCKIFTTQDSLDKFNSTTRCIEELEIEFKKMEQQGKDPKSFELRVRKHPGALEITRPSILKNAKTVKWSYQDQLEMTTQFTVQKEQIESVWENFRLNIAPCFNKKESDLLTYKTTGSDVIEILRKQPNNFDSDRINQMAMFIELCNSKGLLQNWTIALKTTGTAGIVKSDFLNINPEICGNMQLATRTGPSALSRDFESFLKDRKFKATGKSANIMSSTLDMAVTLKSDEINEAKETFYKHKAHELIRAGKAKTKEDALSLAREYKTIPESYFRSRLTENEGILIVYLFDSHFTFNQNGKNSKDEYVKSEFKEFIDKENIDLEIPLVGYAIGFPPIKNDPGGIYMQGDYDLDLKNDEDLGDEGDFLTDINE